ncbi:CGLD27 family protein [Geminocystis sp. GBBB08]|uniref:CGLD27 family protein n=1 Tax=Geminocystis sp. GBBB08 TaxID=2604140 RepID=UPI0027E392F7|nr:CGLD27 family protein [Geminocystis sp. GBBB08]MBL1209556.1 DUF1230 family protein [Geminocystis sp. GBBB08]
MNQPSTIFCPVPPEQQPVNEYQELAQSWFFRWVTLSKWQFAFKLIQIWVLSLIICAPISAASFLPQEACLPFLLSSGLGASLFFTFALIRLYLGWSYIGDRLKKTKIVYEESSWYDGQIWEKPLEFYQRDQLIFQYQVQPILRRLNKSLILLFSLICSGLLALWITIH